MTSCPRPTRAPQALWLWWHAPESQPLDPDFLWRAYVRRFDLEHTFRFLKQTLGWQALRVRHPEQADRWTWLVLAAYTQLRLARVCVAAFRRLARRCELELLYRVAKADSLGRNADWIPREKWFTAEAQEWFIARASASRRAPSASTST